MRKAQSTKKVLIKDEQKMNNTDEWIICILEIVARNFQLIYR